MTKNSLKKVHKIIILILAIIILAFGIYWVSYLQKAHSTFENYYAFRGCRQLVEKTDDFGTCKLADGKIIKIVKFNGKWYLDGDLPGGFLSI